MYILLLLGFRVRPLPPPLQGPRIFIIIHDYWFVGWHNARIGAIAFMPLVMAGIHWPLPESACWYRCNRLGDCPEVARKPLADYILPMMIVGVYGLVQLILALREKQLKEFFATLGMLIPAAVIASATFFGQVLGDN